MKAEDITAWVLSAAITNDQYYNDYPSLNVSAELTAMEHISKALLGRADGLTKEQVQEHLAEALDTIKDIDIPDSPAAIGAYKAGLLLGLLVGIADGMLQNVVGQLAERLRSFGIETDIFPTPNQEGTNGK